MVHEKIKMTEEFTRESKFWFDKLGNLQTKTCDFSLLVNGKALKGQPKVTFDMDSQMGNCNKPFTIKFESVGIECTV